MENVRYAAKNGMELIAITNHGPAKGGPSEHFRNLRRNLPRVVKDITVLRGAEANILNDSGELDLDNEILSELDIVIASCHDDLYFPQGDEGFKKVYTAVINNPQIDILGHLCRNMHTKHLDEIIDLAKNKNKLIEFNQASFIGRKLQRIENSKLLMQKCLKRKANVVVTTDSHFCTNVGRFAPIIEYLKSIGFPEELVINRNKDALLRFLNNRDNKEKVGGDILK